MTVQSVVVSPEEHSDVGVVLVSRQSVVLYLCLSNVGSKVHN